MNAWGDGKCLFSVGNQLMQVATFIVVTDLGKSYHWTQRLEGRGLFDEEYNIGIVLEMFTQE